MMLTHQGTQVLETSRLLLRPFILEDAPAMYHNWASDPQVCRYLTWPVHQDESISRMVLADWVASYTDKTFYQWAIVIKESGQPIGSISAMHINEQIESVEIGYCIGHPWWHQGITSEALQAVIDYLFKAGFSRIYARHDTQNPHSGAVMRKCGMTCEGTLRRSDRNNTGICDATYYAILREEW